MDYLWIDHEDQLKEFCQEIDSDVVSVDTESDHFHAYQAQVCLIQLSAGRSEALIDPLALDRDQLEPLFEIFQNPDIVKILHSARNDIRELDRDYGVPIRNLFDTQVAARLLNTERNSLTWMLEQLIGIDPGKAYKRFDWTTRPIPQKAGRYAVNDVRYLSELRNRFRNRLQEAGWWEPFQQQCSYISGSVSYETNGFDAGGWRGIDGIDQLDGRGRAALQDLYRWRHRLCSEKNRSAVTIFPNGPLFHLARHRPTDRGGLESIRGIPSPLVESHGEEIIEVIVQSRDTDAPPAEPPNEENYDPPPQQQRQCYHALRKWRNRQSESLEIPPEFIATNDTISEIAEDPPDSPGDFAQFSAILPWHINRFGEEMITVLKRA